jgi:hypothetical protein
MTNRRVFGFIGAAAVIVGLVGVLNFSTVSVAGQAAAAAIKTAWGEPDLQGIWEPVYNIPLQRDAKYGDREFYTEAEKADLDGRRAKVEGRDKRVAEIGTERDVAGAYNAVFTSRRYAGDRTSQIVDPRNGRMPAMTPAAQAAQKAEADYRLSLLQHTDTCKNKDRGNACANGTYGPPHANWDKVTPFYNTGRLNRHADAEDGSLGDRCMSGSFPAFQGFKRIVQSPNGISMFYDIGQGQGYQRNIVMNGTPHLPSSIRTWFGDSRGRWEGNTLVIDVTNFSPKSSFNGSRENLHVVERWTRLDEKTLEYVATISDPTVWVAPWTVKIDQYKQDDAANRFYTEPRCFEGNYGFPAMLLGERLVEVAYAEGRGPHPASKDNATCDGGEGLDALGN